MHVTIDLCHREGRGWGGLSGKIHSCVFEKEARWRVRGRWNAFVVKCGRVSAILPERLYEMGSWSLSDVRALSLT